MQELKDEYISNKPLRFFSGRRNVNKLSYRNYIFYRKNEKSVGIVVVSDFSLSRVERDRECENEDTKIVHISEHMRELSAGQFFLCLVQRLGKLIYKHDSQHWSMKLLKLLKKNERNERNFLLNFRAFSLLNTCSSTRIQRLEDHDATCQKDWRSSVVRQRRSIQLHLNRWLYSRIRIFKTWKLTIHRYSYAPKE